ncbi:MAG: HD domain-containing protein, partial [Anaerolinea sp.]|nr:HD domain-containing protein [Anaerolinea sp.]
MPDNTLSLLNVFDLPPEQRDILLYLTRKGPASPQTLAASLGLDAVLVDRALRALMDVNKVRINSQGEAEIILGQTRRRALPAQLLPVLLATDRLYTAQEIAALRLAVPMLQFARAKMGEFADHGPGHALRVKTFATQLSYLHRCSPLERHLLRAAALFHDVGNAADRVNHHQVSADTVEKLTARGDLPFSADEACLIAQLCRWHRGDYDPTHTDSVRGEIVHTGLLASLLRIADRLDIDQRRYDYTEQFSKVVEFFYPQEVPFWNSLRDVLLVRIKAHGETTALQIYTRPGVEDNFQIAALRQAIRGTPFNWDVEVSPVTHEDPARRALTGEEPLAVVACPFDPHSLIMTALSRRHLQQAGYLVRVICYADTASGSTWLWREQLPKLPPSTHGMLVVIGDRPNPAIADSVTLILREWRRANVPVCLLNRHEANWSRLPDILMQGAQTVMGSDGCYFWGDRMTQADMDWSRIAALVTRDPTQTLAGMTTDEEQIAQGFLRVVHEATASLTDDQMNWSSQADPILKRISGDDFAYFRGQASGFTRLFAD